MLSIVVTLKKFRTILLDKILRIYTEHKNLTCRNFNIDRLLIWRLILEEYAPEIEYIKGERNIVAGALLRLPLNGKQETAQKSTYNK